MNEPQKRDEREKCKHKTVIIIAQRVGHAYPVIGIQIEQKKAHKKGKRQRIAERAF